MNICQKKRKNEKKKLKQEGGQKWTFFGFHFHHKTISCHLKRIFVTKINDGLRVNETKRRIKEAFLSFSPLLMNVFTSFDVKSSFDDSMIPSEVDDGKVCCCERERRQQKQKVKDHSRQGESILTLFLFYIVAKSFFFYYFYCCSRFLCFI